MHTVDNIVIYGVHTARLRRGEGGECAAGLPWRLEIAEMRRIKAAKGPSGPEAHEPGKGPKEQNSTFHLKALIPRTSPPKHGR
jgi:hypothetical protein